MARPLRRDNKGNLDRTSLLMILAVVLAAIVAIWRGIPWLLVVCALPASACAIQWLRASPGDPVRRTAGLWLLFWISMTLPQFIRLPIIVTFGAIFVGIGLFVLAITSDRSTGPGGEAM